MSHHIAVLKGGWSCEREVSLSSGAAVEAALQELGYHVTGIDVGRDIAEQLAALKPDCVFNALHGRFGEDGGIQGVLEMLDLPYTHSGVLASALAMDKPTTRRILQAEGIRVAKGLVMRLDEFLDTLPIAPPFVIKPLNEGSSVGVHIVSSLEEVAHIEGLEMAREYLFEAYIAGREIQVAVLGDEALGAIEIIPKEGFYDYAAKYTEGKAEHVMPAPLPENDTQEVLALALRIHQLLGCRGLTRTDFRYDDASIGTPLFYALEINTQPGMTPLSLAPEIAAYTGIGFAALIKRLIDEAMQLNS